MFKIMKPYPIFMLFLEFCLNLSLYRMKLMIPTNITISSVALLTLL